jgi:hypothetical protein
MASVTANLPSGSSQSTVDKLRFSITNWQRDCAKLQRDSGGGLHGLTGSIAFAVQQELELFLIASRSYDLVLEGDLVQTDYDDVGNHSMRSFKIGWSESTKQSGIGSGVVKLFNPEFPNEPCCFDLSVGPCRWALDPFGPARTSSNKKDNVMKIAETLRQAALSRAALCVYASLLLVLMCLWWSRKGVDNYYDQPIVGTPIELVAKYASHYKQLVSKQRELEKMAADFANTKAEATTALENYSKAKEAARIAMDAAGACSEEEFAQAFEAATIARAKCNELEKQVQSIQAKASAKYKNLLQVVSQYEALQLETKRAKMDKESVACGGTRRFVVLDVSKVIRLDRKYVDGIRASANDGDEELLVCLAKYDSAFNRMNKILSLCERHDAVSNAGTDELYLSKRAYDDTVEKAFDTASAENQTLVQDAYQRWQKALEADKLNSALDAEYSQEYRAASTSYENALHAVILAIK